ncbi:MAG: chromate transporter [Candidatus Korobacteraceae bacterium]
MERPSLYRLFLFATRLANLTFGGGEITMAAVYGEIVVSRQWLSAEEYGTCYALSRITPGTNSLAFFAGVGWQLLGWPGALATVLAASVLPGIMVMLLTESYELVRSSPVAMGALSGILAAAVGMMGTAAWSMLQPYFTRRRWIHAAVLAGGSILLSYRFSLSPVQILGLAAVVGLFWRVPE